MERASKITCKWQKYRGMICFANRAKGMEMQGVGSSAG